MAILVKDGACVKLSGGDPFKNANFEVNNEDDNNGIDILYNEGDQGYSFQVDISCNSDYLFANNFLTSDGNSYVASFSSSTGCKNGQISALWTWFKSNKWPMFVVFLLGGLVITFFGRKLFKPVLFITGIIMATSLVMLIFYSTFLKSDTKSWVGWVVLASSLLLGCLLGYVFVKIVRLGAFCLAAWGGFSVGLLLFNAFAYKMNSDVGFWCFTLGFALVFGVLALCFFDHILIHATAILGSFMAIYGIGLVAGKYTNPFTIVELIKHGQMDSIDPIFYAYLAGNIALYVLGVLYQYNHKRKNPDHDPYEDLRRHRHRY